MTDAIITLTDAAITHIKHMLEKTPKGVGFRLSIKKTGCSGYAYVPNIIEQSNETDLHWIQDGLPIYLDPACESFVKEVVVDYVIDTMNAMQKKLVFINPNEKNRCGCGESFTIE